LKSPPRMLPSRESVSASFSSSMSFSSSTNAARKRSQAAVPRPHGEPRE
jgi:hypothetical protein